MAHLGALVLQHLPGRRVVMLADDIVAQLFRSGRLGTHRMDWRDPDLSRR